MDKRLWVVFFGVFFTLLQAVEGKPICLKVGHNGLSPHYPCTLIHFPRFRACVELEDKKMSICIDQDVDLDLEIEIYNLFEHYIDLKNICTRD